MALDANSRWVGSCNKPGGVMRALVILCFWLSLAGLCSAQPASGVPWMTGARLVKLLGNVDPSTVPWAPGDKFPSRAIAAEFRDLVNGEFVHGYIQAVHDSTEGKTWCWSAKYHPLPHELEAEAREALQRMPDTQLQQNAADLIVEVWRKRWPCATGPRSAQ